MHGALLYPYCLHFDDVASPGASKDRSAPIVAQGRDHEGSLFARTTEADRNHDSVYNLRLKIPGVLTCGEGIPLEPR